jgi:WhiB family transcriptional regulator, redox-sensing transcriptional regulator
MSPMLLPWPPGPARRQGAGLRSAPRDHDPVTAAGVAAGRQRRVTLPRSMHGSPWDWMPRSACRGTETELFFPAAEAGRALQQVQTAMAVCDRCEVRASCLSYALETMQHGIWGGTTTDERIAMRRSQAAQLTGSGLSRQPGYGASAPRH